MQGGTPIALTAGESPIWHGNPQRTDAFGATVRGVVLCFGVLGVILFGVVGLAFLTIFPLVTVVLLLFAGLLVYGLYRFSKGGSRLNEGTRYLVTTHRAAILNEAQFILGQVPISITTIATMEWEKSVTPHADGNAPRVTETVGAVNIVTPGRGNVIFENVGYPRGVMDAVLRARDYQATLVAGGAWPGSGAYPAAGYPQGAFGTPTGSGFGAPSGYPTAAGPGPYTTGRSPPSQASGPVKILARCKYCNFVYDLTLGRCPSCGATI